MGITIDHYFMHIVGYGSFSGNLGWLIEKRSLSNGALAMDFGTAGRLVENLSSGSDFATSVVADQNYIYVIGEDYQPGNSEWRIEKRFR
jgi:hypothetical protein